MEKRSKLEKVEDLDFIFTEAPFESRSLMQIKEVSFGYDKSDPLFRDFSLSVGENLRENRVPGQLLFMGKQLPIRCFMSAGSVFGLQFCGILGVVS